MKIVGIRLVMSICDGPMRLSLRSTCRYLVSSTSLVAERAMTSRTSASHYRLVLLVSRLSRVINYSLVQLQSWTRH